jgi:hypothetical protein
MSIAYIRLSRVLLKIRKNTHRCWKLLLVPMWTVSLFNQVTDSLELDPDKLDVQIGVEEAICRCIDR